MKTYEEMAQSALTRGKDIRKQRRNFIGPMLVFYLH